MLVAYEGHDEVVANDNFVIVFVVLAAVIAVIAGGVAAFCIARGGNVVWTTRFWVFVQVACHFR